jgi:hypothetical protein
VALGLGAGGSGCLGIGGRGGDKRRLTVAVSNGSDRPQIATVTVVEETGTVVRRTDGVKLEPRGDRTVEWSEFERSAYEITG